MRDIVLVLVEWEDLVDSEYAKDLDVSDIVWYKKLRLVSYDVERTVNNTTHSSVKTNTDLGYTTSR